MRANIHIRKENEDKWLAMEPGTRSEFVNTLLQDLEENTNTVQKIRPSATPIDTRSVPEIPGVSKGFCPHGFGKGMCKDEKCNRRYR